MKKKKVETVEEVEEVAPVEVAEEVVDTVAYETKISGDNLSEFDHQKIDKDSRYRGPLSYRHFRIIAWIALTITGIFTILGLVSTIAVKLQISTPEDAAVIENVAEIFSFASSLPLPLFLIANFAVILQGKNNYRKLLITYGGIFLAIYIGFLIVYYHYIVMLVMKFLGVGFAEARDYSVLILTMLGSESGLVVNVFVDLFCCVLIMYFINYNPKKFFQGKLIIIFRLLAIVPILFEFLSALLMGLLSMSGRIEGFYFSVPPEILPMIGKKPVGMIIAFVIMCIYIKMREKKYLKKGGTVEGYELYERTNRNSFKFSRVMALTFLIVAIVDLIVFIVGLASIYAANNLDEEYLELAMNVLSGFTVGKSVCLILVIPFILLFDYTKQHKNPGLDKFVPIGGIVLLIFAIFETAFLAIFFML